MPTETNDIADEIIAGARVLGFNAVGFASADLPPSISDQLLRFIELERHGDMAWMAERAIQRQHPQALWPEAKSVIMLGMNYGPDHDPMEKLHKKSAGNISVYAHNKDYHDVVKKKLKQLGRKIAEKHKIEIKVFVDTAPVMEKPLAQQAGLGWQGKHTNLVSQEFGSWLFLGAIFTALRLPSTPAHTDQCGTCTRCLDICPTDAFPAPYQLDARRCISYLTIEHKGAIPHEFRSAMGNRIYGCDDCLAVCPWNKFAERAEEAKFHAREDLTSPTLESLADLDDQEFRTLFSKSPVKRTGRNRFLRNVLIAIGNSADRALTPTLLKRIEDADPLVRGAAVWALAQLAPDTFQSLKESKLATEKDPSVKAEWRLAQN